MLGFLHSNFKTHETMIFERLCEILSMPCKYYRTNITRKYLTNNFFDELDKKYLINACCHHKHI